MGPSLSSSNVTQFLLSQAFPGHPFKNGPLPSTAWSQHYLPLFPILFLSGALTTVWHWLSPLLRAIWDLFVPWHLEQCLVYSGCLINICWMKLVCRTALVRSVEEQEWAALIALSSYVGVRARILVKGFNCNLNVEFFSWDWLLSCPKPG